MALTFHSQANSSACTLPLIRKKTFNISREASDVTQHRVEGRTIVVEINKIIIRNK